MQRAELMQPRALIEALRALPGGHELLTLAEHRHDMALVGGAVRDLLRGQMPRELDVVLAGDTAAAARQLAASLEAEGVEPPAVSVHARFGTAVVEWPAGRVDIATRRAETYSAPGALPDVRAGGVEEDLARRDFTVNAIAAPLAGPHIGEPYGAEHALEDLAAGRLRVLHERSFIEDPTRLLRLARYAARLGFSAEPRTAELAAQALADGALATVSGARVGAELRLALCEADPLAALAAMSELRVLAAIDARLHFDEQRARRALALLPPDGRADLLLLASLLLDPMTTASTAGASSPKGEASMLALLDRLEFFAADRDRVVRSALAAPALATKMARARTPSQLHDALFACPPEAVALAGAIDTQEPNGASAAASQWFERVRHVQLAVTGDDLLAAGVPQGPQVGRALARVLALKLDGQLADDRDAELRAALASSADGGFV